MNTNDIADLSGVSPQQTFQVELDLASGEVRASEPSKGAEDMLNLVLGDGAEKIKQKVSLPPIWWKREEAGGSG